MTLPTKAPTPHPTPEALLGARRGPRDAEKEAVLEHAALCALCAEELRRLSAFDEAPGLPAGELETAWAKFGRPAARRPDRARPHAWALAAAAVAVLAVGLSAIVLTRRPEDGPRGVTPASDGGPQGVLDEAPRAFPLPGGPGSRQVVVYDAERRFEWTSPPSSGTAVAFPEDERRKLRPDVAYYWTVLGDDARAARLFRLRRR